MRKTLLVAAVCALIVILGALAPGVLNGPFDLLALVLGWLGPIGVTVVVSVVTGVLFILAFPHISLQGGIRRIKDRIKANMLAIRLFQDDLPTVARSTGGALGWNFAYIGMNLLPMVFLAGPFMVVWFQLNALYAYQPLQPGQRQMVVVELAPGVDPLAVRLREPEAGPDGGPAWRVSRGPVHTDSGLVFEIETLQEGVYEIALESGGETVTKELAVGIRPRRLARLRTSAPLAEMAAGQDALVWFGEPVLPASSFVRVVRLDYPQADAGPLGDGEIGLMMIYLVVSLAVGFALKGPLGVEI